MNPYPSTSRIFLGFWAWTLNGLADGAGTGDAKIGGARTGGAEAGGARPAVPKITGDCKEKDKVKFATATLQGRALTWWNGRIASMGIDVANGTPWTKNIRGDVTSSSPTSIDEAVRMAYQLMGHIIQDKTDEALKGEKQKGEGDRGGRVYPNCKNKKHARDCWKCGKYGKLGHKIAACRCLDRKDVTCFNCNEKGHLKRDCPKLKKNGQVKLDTFYDVELADGKVDGLVIAI
nr:putative reverse transcriptase domain-containing protein [Tanacetum cinerariifolium]